MTHSPRAVNFSFAVQAFLRSHAACVPKNLLALQNCTQTIRRLVERGRAGASSPALPRAEFVSRALRKQGHPCQPGVAGSPRGRH